MRQNDRNTPTENTTTHEDYPVNLIAPVAIRQTIKLSKDARKRLSTAYKPDTDTRNQTGNNAPDPSEESKGPIKTSSGCLTTPFLPIENHEFNNNKRKRDDDTENDVSKKTHSTSLGFLKAFKYTLNVPGGVSVFGKPTSNLPPPRHDDETYLNAWDSPDNLTETSESSSRSSNDGTSTTSVSPGNTSSRTSTPKTSQACNTPERNAVRSTPASAVISR